MPIYEFYCPDCHRIFNFLSRAIDTRRRPDCPRCGRKRLDRQVSAFAVSTGRSDERSAGPDIDESALERSMAGLAEEAGQIDENDTMAISRLMRGFYERTGMPMGAGMREAMQRMQAGEDPEQIEADLGEILDAEDPLAAEVTREPGKDGRRLRPPAVDDELFEF